MTPELAASEPIPRHPSLVFAPADPLLMDYARTWSIAEPYILRPKEIDDSLGTESSMALRGPTLPLEAVEDGAGAVIKMKTPQLPSFLKQRQHLSA